MATLDAVSWCARIPELRGHEEEGGPPDTFVHERSTTALGRGLDARPKLRERQDMSSVTWVEKAPWLQLDRQTTTVHQEYLREHSQTRVELLVARRTAVDTSCVPHNLCKL